MVESTAEGKDTQMRKAINALEFAAIFNLLFIASYINPSCDVLGTAVLAAGSAIVACACRYMLWNYRGVLDNW